MRKFKKALAFALASAMIVSAVPASAAAKTNSAKGTKSTIYTYTVDKSKKGNPNNKRSWIKVTTKKGYTYKLVNKTKNIVTLTKTRVEAKKTGTAKINVNFYKNGKYVETKSVKITVKKAPMIGAVTLDKTEITAGETTKVSNAGKGTAYFYSSNKDVATVDKTTGEITAKAAGTTTISAVNTITKARVYLTLTVNAQFGAKQSGAKEITVTGSGFTKDSKISVTKGSQTVTFDAKNVTIAADGKSMTIVTNSKIMKGDYKVTVDEKEATFTGEESKVTAIEIPDIAVASKDTQLPYVNTAASGSAVVNYTIKNQFGEDVTKGTSVTVSASRTAKVDEINGTITLDLVQNDKEGDLISVVIINQETGVSANKTVKLSAKSVINEMTIQGIWNKDGKELTEGTMKDQFYLLVDAKDQYGNVVTEANIGDNLLVSVGAGLTNIDKAIPTESGKTEKVTVNGVDYMGIPFTKTTLKAGTATVLLISKDTGKNAQTTVTVADGIKVDKFSASPADVVVGGKDNVFTFTAIDTYGKEITDPTEKMFSDDTQKNVFGTEEGKFRFEKNAKTGKTELIYNAPTVQQDTVKIVNFITKTNQVVTVQFTVKADAAPTTITGLKNVKLGVLSGREIEIKSSNIKLEDQYGYEYSKSLPSGYKVTLVGTDGKTVFGEVTGDYASGFKTTASTGSGDERFTLTLTKTENGKDKVISEYSFTLSAREMKDLDTFKAESKLVYNKNAKANVTVTGVATDGTEVALKAGTDYTLAGTIVNADAATVSGGAIKFDDNKTETKESKVSVIINNTKGSEVELVVKVSNEAPKAAKVEDTTNAINKTKSLTASDVMKAIKVTDQYGETYNEVARVTFSGYGDDVTVFKNNTTSATLTSTTNDITFVTVKYTFNSGLTYTRNITLQ